MTNKLFKTTALLGTVFAFGSGSALAQSPADQVYNPNGGVLDVVEGGAPTPTPAPTTPEPTPAPGSGTAPETSTGSPSGAEAEAPATATQSTPVATATPTTQTQQSAAGELPFTGFDAGFVAIAGLALLAGGLVMRRTARDR